MTLEYLSIKMLQCTDENIKTTNVVLLKSCKKILCSKHLKLEIVLVK